MSREEQFDFYWKEIFTGLAYNPIEFNTYRFDQSMSLPGKLNKLYDLFKDLALNNQEVMDYLKEFVETFDVKLYTTIGDVLVVWLEDGRLADVVRESINEEVIEARNEFGSLKERLGGIDGKIVETKEEVIEARNEFGSLKERLDGIDGNIIETKEEGTLELTNFKELITFETKERLKNIRLMVNFPRLETEVDDSERLQRAVNSFEGNYGGLILIQETLYVSKPIVINKTGITIEGISNKISKIVSRCPNKTFDIKVLYNGKPYTNAEYCKFFMNNITLQAEGEATSSNNAVGLWLQWVFASQFNNLIINNFKRGLVLKSSHLNTFNNLMLTNAPNDSLEPHYISNNVGLSCDSSADEAFEKESNNNVFNGGWFTDTNIDFRGMNDTVITNIDFEPLRGTLFTGDFNKFSNCRFERFDIRAINEPEKYPRFTWFEVGSSCKIESSDFYQSGAHQSRNYPMFRIKGNDNKIVYPKKASYNLHTFTFETGAKNNQLIIEKEYTDFEKTLFNDDYKQEMNQVSGDIANNIIEYHINGKKVLYHQDYIKSQGVFEVFTLKSKSLVDDGMWMKQGCSLNGYNNALSPFVAVGANEFDSYEVWLTGEAMQRIIMNGELSKANQDGVYTFTVALYLQTGVTAEIGIGGGALTKITCANQWVITQVRGYRRKNEAIQPQVIFNGANGKNAYISGLTVVKGNVGALIPNETASIIKTIR